MVEVSFGEFLKSLREKKGMTITELYQASGVSRPYLSLVESGKRGIPSPDILKKLEEPLGYSYSGLMYKAGYIPYHDFLSDDEEIEKSVDDAEKTWKKKKMLREFFDTEEEDETDLNELSIFLTFPDLTYMKKPLTDPDRQRILDMLKLIFPDR